MNAPTVKNRPVPTYDHLPPGGDRLLPRPEAAAYLGLAPRTLANWASAGTGPTYVIVGQRAVRYRLSSLIEYVESLESIEPMAAGR